MSISPVADENGWFTHWISIERDVTERKNEDLQKKLLAGEISQLFNQSVALNETLQQVLTRLAGIGDFSLAEAWLTGTDQQKINRVAKLAVKNAGTTYSENGSLSSFALGQGLPGTVWAKNAVQCKDSNNRGAHQIEEDSYLVYDETVVYGIPIIHNKKVIRAFILGTSRESPKAENLVSILEHVGSYIGTEIRRKQLEQELHQVFSFAPDIIFVAGFDGYFKKINPAATRLLQYSEEELLAVPISQFMHPDDRTKTVVEEIGLSGGDTTHYFENRYLTKSGTIKWLAWTLQPAFEEGLLFGVAKDITTKKEYEEKIKFHANLLGAVGQAVVATDMEGKVIYWNDAAVSIYGWTAAEAVGTMVSSLQTHPSGADAVEMEKQLNEGKSWSGEFMAQNKTGTSFPALISNSCIQNEKGEVIGIIGVSTDITDSKKNELILQKNLKDLAVSNEELEQFAYVASHDLQEPLRMVTSFLNKIETKYGAVIDDKGKQYIGFAVDGAKRMRQIILDLLEFSRIGRLEYDHENINLTDLVEEIKILFRNQITENKAILQTGSLPTLQGHKAPLLLVFQNLIGNALKYKRNGIRPEIHVTATEAVSHWQFSVRDNGIGIDKEYFDRIFIIFQRLHNKEEFSGTGIGLAVTKKIIEKQGGTIWVESEEGQGSTFYFTLAKAPISKSACVSG
ncbi:MAG: PAS domain S-box protein [Chitinophagaceae bacterium]